MTITLSSDSSFDAPASNDLFLHFTLHLNTRSDKDEIFKSETVPYSPNPSWKNIKVGATNNKSLTSIAVRLWIGKEDGFMPALQWEVSLESLNYLGDSLDPENMTFHSNAVILGMHKAFYACRSAVTLHDFAPQYDFNNWKVSYSVFSLQRIFKNVIESGQLKQGASKLRDDSTLLQSSKNKDSARLEKKHENVRRNIFHLDKLLKRERALLAQEKEIANALAFSIKLKEEKLAEDEESLNSERSKFQQKHKTCLNKKLHLSQVTTQLIVRRQSLLSDLSFIFPITIYRGPIRTKSQKKISAEEKSTEKVLSVCSVKLPDAEQFNQKDDLDTSVALGYTSHLVVIISHVLLVPLRYPIVQKGSASTILDLVTEKMTDRERLFPLFVKGNKERFLFNYGVFLLNKDIAQLRYLCGQGTLDIRSTLLNVKLFLEERLGARLLLGSPATSISESPHQLNRISSVGCLSNRTESKTDANNPNGARTTDAVQTRANKPSKLSRSETVPCAINSFKRPSEHASLRSQLFGLDEEEPITRPSEPSSKPFGRNKRMMSITAFGKSRNVSVEPMQSASASTTYLTGLEQSSSSTQYRKMSLAEARAALLGKKTEQRKRGAGEKWPKKTGGSQNQNGKMWSYSDSNREKSSVSSALSINSLILDDICDCDTEVIDNSSFDSDYVERNALDPVDEPNLC